MKRGRTRAGGAEAGEAKRLVRITVPAHHVVGLDRQDRVARRQDRELVLLRLGLKDQPARERDDAGLEALLGEELGRLDGEADLGAGRDERDVGLGLLVDDVAAPGGVLDRRVFELGQVLAREGEDRGRRLGLEGDEVGGRGLVAVGRPPDGRVGRRPEPGDRLDRLVGRAVLAEADRVVRGDPDDLVVREGREPDRAGGVRDKVQELVGVAGIGGGAEVFLGSAFRDNFSRTEAVTALGSAKKINLRCRRTG
jgi:hypothetical protein